MTDPTTPKARSFDMTLDIDALPRDVWDALTNAEELVRWFPLQAEVTPGVGGSMRWAWGDAWSGTIRIDAWDPPRFLRLVDENARPYDVNGKPVAADQAPQSRVVVEVTLETVSGRTKLRLVHSGFGTGAAWDDEIEGISTGWQYELRSLRHYLTRHRGQARHIAQARGSASLSPAETWRRLTGSGGIVVEAKHMEEGSPYTATTAGGDRLSGAIQLYIPNREFAGTASELGDGLFRICTYPAAGKTGFILWAVTYDATRSMTALEGRFQAMLDGLFVQASSPNV